MKIAIAQINPVIGDLEQNLDWIMQAVSRAEKEQCSVIIFSELAITGYLPGDLLQNDGFLDACDSKLAQIQERSGDTVILIGHVERNPGHGKPLFNSVSAFRNGKRLLTARKRLLPNYDVFNENRFFEPGDRADLLELDGVRFGITICEDGWNTPFSDVTGLYDDNPVADCVELGADIIVNMGASPFTYRKVGFREKMFSNIAEHHQRPLIMTNQAGGVDGIVFDGRSAVYDPSGNMILQADAFHEDIRIVDMEQPCRALQIDNHDDNRLIYDALVCGTRDFIRKIGANSVHLGLSGGMDSALVAVIAAHALGADQVTGIMLPSRYSSEGSVQDATQLAENLGIRLCSIPIQETVDRAADELKSELPSLKSITEENLQARTRGLLLMGWSNNEGSILLNTGNKSELAVGYATLYGDMCGALAVIGDVYKTRVYELARFINRHFNSPIPETIITKAPSAELKPDQKDTDSLPPYEELDPILECFVERSMSRDAIIQHTESAPATVDRIIHMVLKNEFKRKQGAPILKVTDRAFGTGFRYPITARCQL